MGKKSRKLRSPKYKAKASAFRETVARLRNQSLASAKNETSTPAEEDISIGFGAAALNTFKTIEKDKEEPSGMEILTTKDLMEESKSDVIVVKNKKKEEKPSKQDRQPAPELQLQEVEVSEPPKKKPNGLKRAQTSRTSTRRKTTKTKKD